jgi:tRNA(fMet)-specific endonuclease VapC
MKNKVLVDTDILSYILKQKNPIVTAHYETYLTTYEQLSISRITVVEILGGLKAKNAVRQLAEFEIFIAKHTIFIAKHTILDTNEEVAKVASEIFAQLY